MEDQDQPPKCHNEKTVQLLQLHRHGPCTPHPSVLVALQAKPSQPLCAGLKWNEHNEYACPYCRSCRFDNVCLNHSSLQIQYYSGKDPVPLFYDMSAIPHHTFPADFLNTGEEICITGKLGSHANCASYLQQILVLHMFVRHVH